MRRELAEETFNPELADCSIGDKRRGDPKSRRSAMEAEERERLENEKRRAECACLIRVKGIFIGSRRGPHALFSLCVRV